MYPRSENTWRPWSLQTCRRRWPHTSCSVKDPSYWPGKVKRTSPGWIKLPECLARQLSQRLGLKCHDIVYTEKCHDFVYRWFVSCGCFGCARSPEGDWSSQSNPRPEFI